MAEANFLIGLLAERFKWMGQPAVNRLAKREAAALSTLAGDRIPTDQLNIYTADRKQGVAEDTLSDTEMLIGHIVDLHLVVIHWGNRCAIS